MTNKAKLATQLVILTSMTFIGFLNTYTNIFRAFGILLTTRAIWIAVILAVLSTGWLYVSIWRN